MIYLIFTQQGFEQVKADIVHNKAELWLNPGILSAEQLNDLDAQSIPYSFLTTLTDVNREDEVIKALNYVEQHTKDKHILVEFL
jgi:hypothetical protein